MGYYFPLILLCLTVFCGLNYIFWAFISKEHREALASYWPYKIMVFFKDFFWVLLIVFLIRTFVASLYNVPTGSLEPTVLPGDILLTTKYNYALTTPVWEHQITKTADPKRGDIVVFRNPVHPKFNLIKRLVGLPGDRISYMNKTLYINGKKQTQQYVGPAEDLEPGGNIPVKKYIENLDGVKHYIIINPKADSMQFQNLVVPKGHYFMMGDNRDGSDDSRYWGFASSKDLIGKAQVVAVNFRDLKRIGKKLHVQ